VFSEDSQLLQEFVDSLYRGTKRVSRLDAVLLAEARDLPADLIEIVGLLPPGDYQRQRLCDQLNSALKGHGWNGRYRSVD
jgi:hypothetical protein